MYGYQSDIPNHTRLSDESEIKMDKIQLILNSLACFPPVCQVTISAETEELVKIITVWIYFKDELNKKILAKQSHIHIIPRHNEQLPI